MLHASWLGVLMPSVHDRMSQLLSLLILIQSAFGLARHFYSWFSMHDLGQSTTSIHARYKSCHQRLCHRGAVCFHHWHRPRVRRNGKPPQYDLSSYVTRSSSAAHLPFFQFWLTLIILADASCNVCKDNSDGYDF